ncbi:head-tail joining protein [Thiohalobacter thiocyanaticus]|uniref:Uncharacterized protein n=1 Tax=Thiohalobacter thiocyanaticus TaxID=585455 RepID=A0A426QG23_9GAMM|nr:hypothetical protein [Thiohalobacter thiocyanaticus]RRQ20701.1 hypothetical protein D6C00_01010 [Thiohalobacter thiocyanaticus]
MSFRDAVLQATEDAHAHLGEDVTLPSGVQVQGVFSYPTTEMEIRRGQAGSIRAPARDPVVSLTETDAAGLVRGDTLTIRGKAFDIVEALPTGTGRVKFTLVETQPTDPSGPTTWR